MSILVALTSMFGMKALSYPGSGAMGAITYGVVCSILCVDEFNLKEEESSSENIKDNPTLSTPERKYNDPKGKSIISEVEHQISTIWDLVFEPLLFGCIGSALKFNLVAPESVAKSIAIVAIGSFLRLIAAFFATAGNGLTAKERCFISLAWLPKATVQAALCSFPLHLIKETFTSDEPRYQEYLEWGDRILSTAILSIILTAPLGVISIKFLGTKLLNHDGNKDDERRDGGETIEGV